MDGVAVRGASRCALAVVVSLVLGAGAGRSAEVPGRCCADLEERIAELEATTMRKGNRRLSLTVSGQVNRSLLYWDDGFQADLYSVDHALSNSRFRFTGNTKLNPDLTAGFHLEFDLPFGARSHQVSQIDDDGFSLSGGILGNAIFGDGIGAAGDSVLGFTQAYWFLTSEQWGKLTVGRQTSSTAGLAIIDVSNTGVIANSQPFAWGGGMIMRNGLGTLAAIGLPPGQSTLTAAATNTWAQQCGGPTIPAAPLIFGGAGPYATDCGLHGLSRRDGISYLSPAWQGFTLSGTFGEDDFWDMAGRYAGEWHGFRIAGGLGHRWFGDREADLPFPTPPLFPYDKVKDTDRRQWLSSVSVMHLQTGLFTSLAWTQYQYRGDTAQELFSQTPGVQRPDTNLYWADVGIQKNWTGWGATTFYAEYGKVFDGMTGLTSVFPAVKTFTGTSGLFPLGAQGVVVDSSMTWWGAGMVQSVDAAATDFYLGFRHYSADIEMGTTFIPGVGTVIGAQIPGGLQDIWYIQGGARIQF